ncbi:MAG TPA: cupin domain-containing protein [Candidatus Nanoarchaeia archaeon]|nr:cupin domain-containing protein [Candidatus Nanoarchaeia archaeon]
MKLIDLNKKIEFNPDKPVKKHFINSKGFHAALICLSKGVEIPPHPENYAVLFTVLNGEGVFTGGEGSKTLRTNECLYLKKDETRGIKAITNLVVLGIQDMGNGGYC